MFVTLANLLLLCGSSFSGALIDYQDFYSNASYRIDNADISILRQDKINISYSEDTEFTRSTTDYSFYMYYYQDYTKPLFNMEFQDGGLVYMYFYPLQSSDLVNSPYYDFVFSNGSYIYGDISNLYLNVLFTAENESKSYTYNFYNNVLDLPSQSQEDGYEGFVFDSDSIVSGDDVYNIIITTFTTQQDGHGYNNGYNDGYNVGYTSGYDNGYNTGYNDGLNSNENFSFSNYLFSIADVPVMYLRSLFGFDLFGESLFAILLSLITLVIVLGLIRRFF